MDNDVFKPRHEAKEQTPEGKGGSSRRLIHKAAQIDSTTGVPTNMQVCMCLP